MAERSIHNDPTSPFPIHQIINQNNGSQVTNGGLNTMLITRPVETEKMVVPVQNQQPKDEVDHAIRKNTRETIFFIRVFRFNKPWLTLH